MASPGQGLLGGLGELFGNASQSNAPGLYGDSLNGLRSQTQAQGNFNQSMMNELCQMRASDVQRIRDQQIFERQYQVKKTELELKEYMLRSNPVVKMDPKYDGMLITEIPFDKQSGTLEEKLDRELQPWLTKAKAA